MKVIEEQIRRITISEISGLDPIRVALEDIAPGKGRINIECYGTSWASYWGGMGDQKISEFFVSCNEQYLADKLSNIDSQIFDPDRLRETLKREIVTNRRSRPLWDDEPRRKYDAIDDIEIPDNIQQLWGISHVMHEMLGDEWWLSLPMKSNPDYEYLCRIIITVQAALLPQVEVKHG